MLSRWNLKSVLVGLVILSTGVAVFVTGLTLLGQFILSHPQILSELFSARRAQSLLEADAFGLGFLTFLVVLLLITVTRLGYHLCGAVGTEALKSLNKRTVKIAKQSSKSQEAAASHGGAPSQNR